MSKINIEYDKFDMELCYYIQRVINKNDEIVINMAKPEQKVIIRSIKEDNKHKVKWQSIKEAVPKDDALCWCVTLDDDVYLTRFLGIPGTSYEPGIFLRLDNAYKQDVINIDYVYAWGDIVKPEIEKE